MAVIAVLVISIYGLGNNAKELEGLARKATRNSAPSSVTTQKNWKHMNLVVVDGQYVDPVTTQKNWKGEAHDGGVGE